MNLLSLHKLNITRYALVLSTVFYARYVAADSFIRITGDKASTGDSSKTVITAPRINESSNIRIVGDKSSTQTPTNEQATKQEATKVPSHKQGIRIVGDKSEAAQKKEQELLAAIEAAEQERKIAEAAEQERLARIKIEQENAATAAARQAEIIKEQELLAIKKADEIRKAAEIAEQERLAKIKLEQEKIAVEAAARQAAIIKEQEQLAAIKAAELIEMERLAKAKIETKRIEAEIAKQKAAETESDNLAKSRDEDKLLAKARKALLENPAANQTRTTQPVNIDNSSSAGNKIPSTPDTIWNLYISAKANDPGLGRSTARVAGSKADSDVLFASLMPHINSSAGVKQVSQSLMNYSANDSKSNYSALNYSATANLNLLHVPTIYSLSAAAAGLSGERAGVSVARQNLIVKFSDSYFALLKAQTDKEIAQGEINRLKQVLEQSRAFLRAGTGDVIAVYEAQSRLDGAGADLTKSESNLRLAEQKLSTVVGRPVSSIENYLPPLPTGPDPDNLDWWLATMEREQPLIRQARDGLTQTSEQKKAAKAEFLPTLQASGGYDVNRGTAALPTAEVRQWFVGATISLPIFSGGETSAKIRRATASEEERQHIFNETMDQQRENVKQAFFNLRYNISYIKALEQKRDSAEIQLAAIQKGRKIGTRNAIDVLNAEQAYSIALRDYKYALYDNFIRVIQLKSAAGILAEDDVAAISNAVAPTLSSELKLFVSKVFR